MSERSETTEMLSALVEKRLSRRCNLWAAEVTFPRLREPNVRIDYMGFVQHSRDGFVGSASVELGTFEAYEVKSCMADYESGHGLSFIGDRNYLVCTRELAERLRDELRIPWQANAVLVPDKGCTRLLSWVEHPFVGSLRERPASEMLWQMVRARYTRYETESEVDHD